MLENKNHNSDVLSADVLNNMNPIQSIELAQSPKYIVYREDKLKLYHFNRNEAPVVKTPVLVVYALVNTWKMLDLQPDRSYLKNLLDAGLDIYLIDWGIPDWQDRFISMEDYINGYINNCVNFILNATGFESINLMGVCQGGTFGLIYSTLFPKKIKNIITHVTPVDFSSNDGLLFKWSKDMNFDTLVDNYHGIIPGEFLNSSFEMLKPMMKISKSYNLSTILLHEEKVNNFMRMEKWIAESPAQAGECFRQFMKELYQQNKLIKGELKIGDRKVHLKNITMPLLNIYAIEDHLVPPSSTIPLNDYVGSSDNTLYAFKGGHIGVFVGSQSQNELAPAVFEWLLERD